MRTLPKEGHRNTMGRSTPSGRAPTLERHLITGRPMKAKRFLIVSLRAEIHTSAEEQIKNISSSTPKREILGTVVCEGM